MKDEVVFHPDHSTLDIKHVALITGGFFVIVQLFVLDSIAARIIFTLAFSIFLFLGFWLSLRHSKNWPKKIVINRSGIYYDAMQEEHGVDLIPWNQVDRMDLFYSAPKLPPHLCIGLRPGSFHNKVKKNRLQQLGAGLDINIPVSVNVAPEEVLNTAQQFWKQAEQ